MISGNINGSSFSVYTYGEIIYSFWTGIKPSSGYITWDGENISGTLYYYSYYSIYSTSLPTSENILDCNRYIPNLYFSNCTWTGIAVNFPSTTMYINGMFMKCSTLRTAALYNCSYIGENTFVSCYNLRKVNAPSCGYLGSAAFMACSSLQYVSLPVCKYVGEYAFTGCAALEKLNLPECRYISPIAFVNGCGSLSELILGYSSIVVTSSGFGNLLDGTGITSSRGSIYVPSSLVSSYKTDAVWSYYSNRIFPILV